MKIVLFEFRKNILRKTIIIPMVILLIVNVMVIYAQYRFQNDPFSSEVNRYHSSAREWEYYKELHAQFDGEITEEKQDKIIKLYDNLKEKIDNADYQKGYTKSAGTGYIFGDYSLIETNFYQPIKNLVSYAEKNKKLVDQAKENIKFYKKADNRYELKKNQHIVKKYQDRVIYDFYDTTGFQKLLDYNFSDVILMIFCFYVLCIILSRTNLWDGRYDSGDQKRQKNICCREVYFSDSSNYNVYGSDCVCELYCILHNLRAERISNAHICIRRIPIFTI